MKITNRLSSFKDGITQKVQSFSVKKAATNIIPKTLKDAFNKFTGKTEKHNHAITDFRNHCDNIKNTPTSYRNKQTLAKSLCDIKTSKLEKQDFDNFSQNDLNFAAGQITDFIETQNKTLNAPEYQSSSTSSGDHDDARKNLKLANKALEKIDKIKKQVMTQNVLLTDIHPMASADPRQLEGFTPSESPTGDIAESSTGHNNTANRVNLDDDGDLFSLPLPPKQTEILPATAQRFNDTRTQTGSLSPRSSIDIPTINDLPQLIKNGNIDDLKQLVGDFSFDVNEISPQVLQLINSDDLKNMLSELPKRSDNIDINIVDYNINLYFELSQILYRKNNEMQDIRKKVYKEIGKDAEEAFQKFTGYVPKKDIPTMSKLKDVINQAVNDTLQAHESGRTGVAIPREGVGMKNNFKPELLPIPADSTIELPPK